MDHIANATCGIDGVEMWSDLESCSGQSEEHQDGPPSWTSALPQEEMSSRSMEDAQEGQLEKRRKIQLSPLKEIQVHTNELDLSLGKVGRDHTAQITKPRSMTSSRSTSRISDEKVWKESLMQCYGKAVSCLKNLLRIKGALMEVCFLKRDWRLKGLLEQMLSARVSSQILAATDWLVRQ